MDAFGSSLYLPSNFAAAIYRKMDAFGSSLYLPSNFDAARSNHLFSPFKGLVFGIGQSLSRSLCAYYAGPKLSSTRRSLNQNGCVSGPNPGYLKARLDGSAIRVAVAAAASFATSSVGLLFGLCSLVTLNSNAFKNQVLKAPDTVTPSHFTPAHFAVGVWALLIILMAVGVYKWANNSGTDRPGDVQRNSPINGAREALPTKKIVNISLINFNLFNDGETISNS